MPMLSIYNNRDNLWADLLAGTRVDVDRPMYQAVLRMGLCCYLVEDTTPSRGVRGVACIPDAERLNTAIDDRTLIVDRMHRLVSEYVCAVVRAMTESPHQACIYTARSAAGTNPEDRAVVHQPTWVLPGGTLERIDLLHMLANMFRDRLWPAINQVCPPTALTGTLTVSEGTASSGEAVTFNGQRIYFDPDPTQYEPLARIHTPADVLELSATPANAGNSVIRRSRARHELEPSRGRILKRLSDLPF